jgi:hypothetical protein
LDKRLIDGGKFISPKRQPHIEPRAIVQPEGLGKLEKKFTSLGREPAIFQLAP